MARGIEWRTIARYPQYEVSNDGEVRCKGKGERKQFLNRNGYLYINIWDADKGQSKPLCVHRVVAEAFIDNPQGKRCINHKDGNKQNNCIENLEWCTHRENELHKTYVLGRNPHQPKAIVCKESGITYRSVNEAGALTGIPAGNIRKTLQGKRHTAGGYHWRWSEKGK